jgi:hypothetical protein
MTPVATIGSDIAKTVFQVHGVNAAGQVVIRQRLTRGRVLAFFEKLTCSVSAICKIVGAFFRRVAFEKSANGGEFLYAAAHFRASGGWCLPTCLRWKAGIACGGTLLHRRPSAPTSQPVAT